ncbi:MAG: PIN domain-containing protein [Gammaproteobacteria bacterium]|nr:PIN domain-containing protein [Gammaproteobacteria bacterium]
MKTVFADTAYWVAVFRPRDQWRSAARFALRQLGPVNVVTTDEVLTEFLASASRGGPEVRLSAVRSVRELQNNPRVRVMPQSRESFRKALDRYAARTDKSYSLQDCVSMNVMEAQSITEILTSDRHFEQEGFTVLMKRASARSKSVQDDFPGPG